MNTSLIRSAGLVVVCAALSVGCASDRQQRHDDARNAAVGAVGGAVIGAATGGNALTGAAVGAVAGALIGRLMVDGREREVYSDGRGGRYWRDEDGRHHPVR
ncbi:YMGG-like glycine zipper-containing protein [Mitsuaria sp. GD03876]|uniref:YMGG-like glycine zipper-containing protein n=1 Tax=Mitsuaria sp. GD03876 TaxID=2975399 RepID=UPI002446ED62|nr:YMGG-like glycine zipper-containing protein [Mitsuaria sp. GD03876]MDH0863358.1 YMGG-like glycine zipper-containing protein [Mitsuaria sp. GD03876]